MKSRTILCLGALIMAVGVGLGAFGAHALRAMVDASALATWQTAVLYQLLHGLGLLLIAALGNRLHPAWQSRSAVLMLVGVLIFSGSLYILVLSGVKWLGAITPIGGVAMILAWLCLAFAAVRGQGA
ncbi:DUF423 domain-containing protein [Alcaligenes ammonioxydans]|uniref:DUF423 domain-containing protein n=1 Tax=Alcaligenes ammonioxydans TaxID=2582914 RepID=A0ABX8SQR6_9BURK|nr:DUF423 domain-containing protein [Alcaligenes ammonioxydans]MCH1879571.1 DUF423 domain-containing protein [Alcaligenes ammonioxydans]QXX78386.1 DUF423 domain-containing protein [Alcaligenes ammonioxydans]HRK85963.1 DUF423 domain-containing protein [Alcaligenes faecalis]